MLLTVYAVTDGSGMAVAGITLAEIVPMLALGLIAGVYVDRWDRRRAIILGNTVRGLLSLALVLAARSQSLGLVYVVIAASEAAGAVVQPAMTAIVPQLVPVAHLAQVNTLFVLSRQFSLLIGPVVAATAYRVIGAELTFLVDGGTFFVGAGTALAIRRPREVEKQAGSDETVGSTWWRDFLNGLARVRGDRLVMALLATIGLQSLGAGINNTVMIVFINRGLGRAASDIAWLSSANGLAQILAATVVAPLIRRRGTAGVLAGATITMLAGNAILAGSWSLFVLIVGVLITALGNSPFTIVHTTVLQQAVGPEYLGRVQGSLGTLAAVLFMAASSASGVAVDYVAARSLLIVSAGISASLVVVTLTRIVPALRAAKRLSSGRSPLRADD
ncbi:major facilitator superfamily protein [Limnochorda pilosa]|uniref:Major facilitator superfamily protein n=1 Tax=Limnochorda pilosa TaxID=1555112 RepID=A0A0K2SJV6_LIMPI|nr:major facilitator superfamily protein [Limnochorda pilosa]